MRNCPECGNDNTSVHPICYYCLVEFWYSHHKEFINPRPRRLLRVARKLVDRLGKSLLEAKQVVDRLDNAVGNRVRPTIDKTDRVIPKRKYVPGLKMKKQ